MPAENPDDSLNDKVQELQQDLNAYAETFQLFVTELDAFLQSKEKQPTCVNVRSLQTAIADLNEDIKVKLPDLHFQCAEQYIGSPHINQQAAGGDNDFC